MCRTLGGGRVLPLAAETAEALRLLADLAQNRAHPPTQAAAYTPRRRCEEFCFLPMNRHPSPREVVRGMVGKLSGGPVGSKLPGDNFLRGV